MDRRCLLDHNERLVVTSVRKKHRVIEPKPDSILAAWATEQVA
jgi:hypothetical protein